MHAIRSDYSRLLDALKHSAAVLRTADTLSVPRSTFSIKTLTGSSRAVLVAALWGLGDLPVVVITPDDQSCDELQHDLGILIGADSVGSVRSASRASVLGSSATLHHDQVDALSRLKERPRFVLVASAPALALALPSSVDLGGSTVHVTKGDTLPYDAFVMDLAVNGFERQDYVSKPGDMAIRGGIIDIFPGGWDNPLRLEFWGDTVESIREFEPMSQRSIREHDTVTFLGKVFHEDDTALTSSLLDHVPTDALMVLDGPEAIAGDLHRLDETFDTTRFENWSRLLINPLGDVDHQVQTTAQPVFSASIEQLLKSCGTQLIRHHSVFLGADGANNARRIRELCDNVADQLELDYPDIALAYHRTIDSMWFVSAALSAGFIWEDEHLVCFTEHQVFGRQRAQRRTKRNEGGISIRELQSMHRGDYVVHADKGIGRFEGLEAIVINGSTQECVKLAFAGEDVLYVHLNYVHKLSKYASEEGAVPKLSKLGSAEWERKKSKAKKKIKDIARDLIKLYAQRKSQPGFAFPVDTVWQKEFEASFQYEDTPDQSRATAEVKLDMEQSSPMDRLVCGDVGFGKTEVAIRAAFKAAQAGKQVAVLVPTTILAQQHYVTFTDRLHRYPVAIEVLSRFRTRTEQKEVLERLGKGKVDIVVGTHRLLSKDVIFKNLGLLIIDEEHRFGVAAKEKLRSLRASIDTLTLTATPIPRTLNFSLMGARDLSVIETPPRNRLPIKTEILQWEDDILREALLRELERGGQAFVVTDRIGDMDKLMIRINMLVPSLKVCIAHGQMETEELENVMEGFLERRYDVLIATKIIESGLDIPNANTMIIVNADNFGLAELYQLRGRVGRSNIQAYCYLVIPPVHTLSRTALRRLQALEEYTDLGSGFQLAMRDLEIRGAGNLLGGEQSGFIMEMGFELYQKILDEAVSELRSDEFSALFTGSKHVHPSFANEDVAIELDVDALLPKEYIPADTDRYEAYKRLYNAHTHQEVDTVFAELRDRFGAFPEPAEELLFAVRLRIAALPIGLVRVNLRGTRLMLEMPPDSDTRYYEEAFPRLLPIITSMKNARFVQNGKRFFVEVQLGRRDDAIAVLDELSRAVMTEPVATGEEEA
ncbi:MAG: transcription-repair coupling factor ['Candidatus Kapabacteria' thiocyanatum]|uniref:Transcription-repair-coupling factor n=1 Tax=Candidatus Kapaibacterium thiocyanatum TaxID=1895771 RepID=A0A1M3L1Y6_9BACT|nr:transcription-repair coupling factor ['Candidatus Kapabacteria' thiocyanatum]OJX59242.1 MAG: transcription-repair coupling factor ['Candidatus Kapabacteria' thiocyanatum]